MKNITERHVQAVWYDMKLRPRRLVDVSGSEINVVDPGEWNLEEGPDFKNAVLEVGGERRRCVGDVEVHLCPSDWDFHGHGADPRYRNVIAHVTWKNGPAPKSLPEKAISIWLGRCMENASVDMGAIDLAAYPYAVLPGEQLPCEKEIGHDPDRARLVLRTAGGHRLRMKARRIAGLLCSRSARGCGDRRQLFYEEVMTALGYRRNSVQFRHIAERVPIAALPTDPLAAKCALATAGMFEDWDRAHVRPNNSPERRLERAVDMLFETNMLDMVDADSFSILDCQQMLRMICAGHHIGHGRAAAIIANVVVPFAMAEGRLSKAPEWLPAEDISNDVRITAGRLFGRDHNPAAFYAGNGLLIQGLLQVRRDWCLECYPDCEKCRVAA